MISILNDLQSLLREPTVEVAERAEQFLAELSRLETLHAQLLVRGEREDALWRGPADTRDIYAAGSCRGLESVRCSDRAVPRIDCSG